MMVALQTFNWPWPQFGWPSQANDLFLGQYHNWCCCVKSIPKMSGSFKSGITYHRCLRNFELILKANSYRPLTGKGWPPALQKFCDLSMSSFCGLLWGGICLKIFSLMQEMSAPVLQRPLTLSAFCTFTHKYGRLKLGLRLLFISETASAKSLLYKNLIASSIWAIEQL
jgi:hypothetical protein